MGRYRKTEGGMTHVRRVNMKAKGMDPEEYDRLYEEQDGRCAACGLAETGNNQFGPLRLAWDHDHQTMAKRGLLCMRCNTALGLLADDANTTFKLAEYRSRYP